MEIINRTMAKAKGFNRFFTGKPCKYGHVAERYTSNYICVECNKKKAKPSDYRVKKGKDDKDPELNYAQIGKAIMNRMDELRKLAELNIDIQAENERLIHDNRKLTDKIKEQHDSIEKLNQKISQLNQAKQDQPEPGKFKFSEIATIR